MKRGEVERNMRKSIYYQLSGILICSVLLPYPPILSENDLSVVLLLPLCSVILTQPVHPMNYPGGNGSAAQIPNTQAACCSNVIAHMVFY